MNSKTHSVAASGLSDPAIVPCAAASSYWRFNRTIYIYFAIATFSSSRFRLVPSLQRLGSNSLDDRRWIA